MKKSATPALKWLRVFACGTLGFLVACICQSRARVWPGYFHLALNHLATHPEYDTLFLGPSYVKAQIDAKRFDKYLSSQGIQRTSFNLGISNWGLSEMDVGFEALLELPLKNVRTVFMDITMPAGRIEKENLFKIELSSFQSPYGLFRAWRFAQFPHTNNREFYEQTFFRGLNAVANLVSFGRGSHYLREKLHPAQPNMTTFQFAPEPGMKDKNNDRNFDSYYLQQVVQKKELTAKRTCDWNSRSASFRRYYLEKWREALSRRNIQLVLIVAPVTYRTDCFHEWPDGSPMEIIQLDDPQKESALYALPFRFNLNHVNPEGAKIYTDRLAKAAIPFLSEGGRKL